MLAMVSLTLTAGFILDLLFGDPRWLPHPVRLIGRLASWAQPRCRQLIANECLAGVVFTFGVVATLGGGVWVIVWGLRLFHPLLAGVATVYFVYAGLATRDLASEATAVWRKLQGDELDQARQQLSRI